MKISNEGERLATIEAIVQNIQTDVSDIKFQLRESYATKDSVNVVSKRVEELEDNNKWIVRLIIGMVITAVIGAVMLTR